MNKIKWILVILGILFLSPCLIPLIWKASNSYYGLPPALLLALGIGVIYIRGFVIKRKGEGAEQVVALQKTIEQLNKSIRGEKNKKTELDAVDVDLKNVLVRFLEDKDYAGTQKSAIKSLYNILKTILITIHTIWTSYDLSDAEPTVSLFLVQDKGNGIKGFELLTHVGLKEAEDAKPVIENAFYWDTRTEKGEVKSLAAYCMKKCEPVIILDLANPSEKKYEKILIPHFNHAHN